MLSICLGKVSDIDIDRTRISDQGSEEDRGKEYHLYEAKVYFTHPVDWIELGQRRYNSPSMGIDIVYLDVEDKDPEDLADNFERIPFTHEGGFFATSSLLMGATPGMLQR